MENKIQEIPKKKKFNIWYILIGVAVVVAVAAWFCYDYYNNGPCGVKVVDAGVAEMDRVLDEFLDIFQVASNTGRINLSGPIIQMQEVKRDMEDLDVPVCLIPAKEAYVLAIENSVEGFLAFMNQSADSLIDSYFDKAVDNRWLGDELILEVLECYPFCD
jgi:hypothetical protein